MILLFIDIIVLNLFSVGKIEELSKQNLQGVPKEQLRIRKMISSIANNTNNLIVSLIPLKFISVRDTTYSCEVRSFYTFFHAVCYGEFDIAHCLLFVINYR